MQDLDPFRLLVDIKSLTKVQKFVIGLSVLSLILSMIFPAFYIDRKDYDAWSNGPGLFFLGWMGLLIGDLECLIWFANPIYLLALIFFMRGNKSSIVLSLIATLIAFSFSALDHIVSDEAGGISKITSFKLGYKLWLASFAILFIGSIIHFVNARKRRR